MLLEKDRRSWKIHLLFWSFMFVSIFFPIKVKACSCVMLPKGMEFVYRYSDADKVFLGEVISIEDKEELADLKTRVKADTENSVTVSTLLEHEIIGKDLKVTVKVLEKFKGDMGDTLVIATPGGSTACGYPFVIAQKYIIYSNNNTTTSCSPNKKIEDAQSDIQALRETKEPGWNYKDWHDKYFKMTGQKYWSEQ